MSMEAVSTGTPLPSTAARRLWRGLGSVALGQIIAAAGSILMVPLFLRAWGIATYGWWVSLTAFVSYLSLLDLGGQSFIGNLLADSSMRKDDLQFRRRFSEGVSLFSSIFLAGMLILAGVLLIPGLSLPGKGVPLSVEERLIVFLLGTLTLLAIPGGVYVTAYRATGRFARGVMLGNIMRGGTLLLLAALLYYGSGPLLYAVATLGAGIALTIVIVRDLHRQVPASRNLELSREMARTGRVHLGGSLYFWLLALSSALNLQGVILVLGMSGPWETVAVYATHRTASGLIGYVGTLVQAPLWPELTFLHAQDRGEDLRRTALLAVKVVVLLSGFAALAMWLFLPAIYPLWTGRQLQLQPALLAIFLLQAVLMAGWSTSAWALLSSNRHRGLACWSVGNAVFTIILALLLGPRFGAVGVVLASLLGDIACGFAVYPRLAAKSLDMPVSRLYAAMLMPWAALAPVGLLLLWVSSLAGGWPGICLGALVGLACLYPAALLAIGRRDLDLLAGKLSSVAGLSGVSTVFRRRNPG
jgi:O-antigen/teichoic acid export membrane protein